MMNSYDLSRNFWNWAFDNPEKISPNHAAIYFFAIEHCNRLGWKEKFGFPSQMTMDAIGIKKHSTYIRYFNDLVEYKFFELIQKSHNQYSSNIIRLTSALPKKGEAMDKAMLNHRDNHTANQKEYNKTTKQETTKQVRKPKFDSEDYKHELWDYLLEYCEKNNLDVKKVKNEALKAYEYYKELGWKNSNNKKIINPKSTIRNNWLSDLSKFSKDAKAWDW